MQDYEKEQQEATGEDRLDDFQLKTSSSVIQRRRDAESTQISSQNPQVDRKRRDLFTETLAEGSNSTPFHDLIEEGNLMRTMLGGN